MLQLAKDSTGSTLTVTGSIDANIPAPAQKEFDRGLAALSEGGKEKDCIGGQAL